MISLGDSADIKWWFQFLCEECGLEIGQDWSWAWHDNAWAVEFNHAQLETLVRLKLRGQ